MVKPITVLLVVVFCFAGVLSSQAQQLFPIKKDKKWGLINSNGEMVLDPIYSAIGEFKHFGYAVMQRDDGVGLLDQNVNEVISPIYEDVKVLDQDLIAVMDQGEWMVINIDEEIVLEKGYSRVYVWEGEYLAFIRNQKWGLAKKDGTLLSEPAYEGLKLIDNQYFETQIEDKIGLLSLNGTVLLKPKYKEIKIIHDDLFLFKEGRRWGGVDGTGREVFPPLFDSFSSVNDFFVVLVRKNLKYLYSQAVKDIVSKDEFSNFYDFDEDYVLAKSQRRLGLISKEGETVLEAQYYEIHAYAQDLYRVNYEGKWGIVSTNDEVIIPFEYDYIAPSKNRVCAAKKGNFFTAINLDGEELIEAKYQTVLIEEDMIRATVNGTLEIYSFDEEGKIVDESVLDQHYTISIGGNDLDNRRTRGRFWNSSANYLLDGFEWYYAPKLDKWGLRKLSDGTDQIAPIYDWVKIKRDYGFTMVFVEDFNYMKMDKTEFRSTSKFGLVNNEVGKLTTLVNMVDIRFEDFEKDSRIARMVFADGRHGLITHQGKIIKKNLTYIGAFHDGMARFSQKGKLSIHLKKKDIALETTKEFSQRLVSALELVSYTQYDQDLYNQGNIFCTGCQWGYIDTTGAEVVLPIYDFAKDYVNGISMVERSDKWGVLDSKGKTLIPCDYDQINFLENTDNSILKVSKEQQKYGLIDTLGQVTVSLMYDELGEFREGRLAVRKGNKWGFVDKHGREVIPCRFTKVNNFSEGFATVKLSSKWGLINKLGETMLEFEHSALGNYANGLVWFRGSSGKGYMDINGRTIIEPKLSVADDFYQGVARVKVDGKFGLLDPQGDFILRPKYILISEFNNEGLAIASKQGKRVKYEVIDLKGNIITQTAFRNIQPYREGYAAVRLDDQYGFIDNQGKLAIKNTFSKVSDFSEGLASVQVNGKCGYINTEGETIIPLEFSKCLDFQDGKAVVYNGYRKAGLIDQQGDYLIKPGLNRLMNFNDGRGLVRDEKYRFYYITEQAKLYDGFYDNAGSFEHGVAVVQVNGLWGVINQKGIEVIQPKYNKIENFENGYAKVRINSFSGLSNLEGKMIVAPDYEYISYAGDGIFRVEQGDLIGYFDQAGTWIWGLQK
jgi:hypothetical protein